MRTIKVHEKESNTGAAIATILVGAVAGFAVGMYVAQRVGGFSGLVAKLRPRRKSGETRTGAYYEAAGEGFLDEGFDADDDLDEDDFDESEFDEEDADGAEGNVSELEHRVLEAFSNDPILSERAIDIGGVGADGIELEGWVDDDTEAEHAVTIARGVPGVRSVANRLMVDAED
jgi:hypothetical protein